MFLRWFHRRMILLVLLRRRHRRVLLLSWLHRWGIFLGRLHRWGMDLNRLLNGLFCGLRCDCFSLFRRRLCRSSSSRGSDGGSVNKPNVDIITRVNRFVNRICDFTSGSAIIKSIAGRPGTVQAVVFNAIRPANAPRSRFLAIWRTRIVRPSINGDDISRAGMRMIKSENEIIFTNGFQPRKKKRLLRVSNPINFGSKFEGI
jgi:hypothetical protein